MAQKSRLKCQNYSNYHVIEKFFKIVKIVWKSLWVPTMLQRLFE